MDLDTLNKIFASRYKNPAPEFELISDKKPVSPEEIAKRKNIDAVYTLKRLVSNYPAWSINYFYGYCWRPVCDTLWERYLTKDENGEYNGIRWDRIHGKHRKKLKFELKNCNKEIDKQYKVWDKYAGRQDVAYIYIYIYILNITILKVNYIINHGF